MKRLTQTPLWRSDWLLMIIGIITFVYGAVVSNLANGLEKAKRQNKALQLEVETLKEKYH